MKFHDYLLPNGNHRVSVSIFSGKNFLYNAVIFSLPDVLVSLITKSGSRPQNKDVYHLAHEKLDA